MRKVIIVMVAVILLITPVEAMEFTAPEAPATAEKYMPEDTQSLWDGLVYIFKDAVKELRPRVAEAADICASLIVIVLVVSLLSGYSGIGASVVGLVSTLTIGALLLNSSTTMVNLGVDTIQQISEYGKMLLPVMTAAMAAQGGTATSTALYTGTTIFNIILSTTGLKIIIPAIYIYLALCIADKAIKQEILSKIVSFVKWLLTWVLKIILYAFMAYISISGVITGTVDATALKATKLAVSGLVPVIGNIISDASETILLSAGVMKNAVGVYGLLAVTAIYISPFVRIGLQYLLLKITSGVCSVFGNKNASELIKDFATAMGFLLATTGVMCLIYMVSTVCFMRGISNG